jgi:4-hydroxy-tetrahydrodipicolinate reductase
MNDSSSPTRVMVIGVAGRMGQEVLRAVTAAEDLEAVAGVDVLNDLSTVIDVGAYPGLQLFKDVSQAMKTTSPDVAVDFTNVESCMNNVGIMALAGIHIVIGTTGLADADVSAINDLAIKSKIGVMIAPNFALGAALLMHLSKISAPYFEYVDVHEAHHENKIDSPSGTAMAIVRHIENNGNGFKRPKSQKDLVPGSRGGDYKNITVFSSRMPGKVAHHEVTFGTLGQTLTIRHDSINRESFMPGVLLAIRHVLDNNGLIVGLENLLEL